MPAIIRPDHSPILQNFEPGQKTHVPSPRGLVDITKDTLEIRPPSKAPDVVTFIDTPFTVIDDAVKVGIKPLSDDFNYENMMGALSETLTSFAKLPVETRAEIQSNVASIQTDAAEKIKAKKMSFEQIQAEYFKSMFGMLAEYDESLSISMLSLRDEISRMSEQRDEEFQKIHDRLARNQWYEWAGLGSAALTGAIAVVAMGTGWGAVAVGVAALAAIALSADNLLDDPVKHGIATLGAGGDHQTIQDRMANLEAFSAVLSMGCTLVSIFSGGDAITKGRFDVLLRSAGIITGLSQLSVTAGEAKNTMDRATIEQIDQEIERDDTRINAEVQLIEESQTAFKQFARQRREMIRAEHQAAMSLLR